MCVAPPTLNQLPENRSPRRQEISTAPSGVLRLLWLPLTLLLGSCMTTPTQEPPPAGTLPVGQTVTPAPTTSSATGPWPAYCQLPLADAAVLGERQVWERLRDGFVLWDIRHPRMQREIKRLLSHPPALQAMLEQARPWLPYISRRVAEHGLPMELALLPAVESGFRPYAYSPSGAAGLWQFMPATGRMRGLTLDWWFDGRRDLIDGTEAALNHLEALNKDLDGDWLHALAAYNAGRGALRKAIRKNAAKGKPTDFWSLDLPAETDAYVPRLLALTAIVANPERYGITLPDIPDQPQFAVIDIRGQIDLGVAARLAGMKVRELAALNAGLNRLATPPDGPHRLLIPQDRAKTFIAALDALPEAQRLQRSRYTVKHGDTLSGIAARHGITVAALKAANNMHKVHIRVGQDLLVPRYDNALALAPIAAPQLPRSRVHYQVAEGDSLYDIAQKFRVSVGQLRRWNRLSGSLLRPGQRLTLFVDPARQTL